jgi:asparagine synthase (glutamine-hydrolysing)
MCGIAGIFKPAQARASTPSRALVTAMTDTIAHRGPDGSGVFVDQHVGLGHRRLSIIDVATGQQPLFNEDGQVAVVFNGEIYNFQELVAELEACGHVFRTKSDTEVIVHGWEEWGAESVKRFRGMFSFALWDRRTRTFFAARDRMGVKPFYYGMTTEGDMVFASELKAMLIHPRLARDIRSDAADDYFAYGYVPDPKTILRSCFKLPPAHSLLWRVEMPQPFIQRYWQIDFEASVRGDVQALCDELRERLSESVRLRMISEVPIGAFLSGGVDSSAVVAVMAGLSDQPVKTCSIGFDVPGFDESAYAQSVADRYKTDHFSRVVTVNDFDLIEQLAGLYDEPFADSSAIPTFRVCQLARERVTVALSGDGGDETFGGYRRYRMHLAEERLRNALPQGLRKMAFGTLAALYPKADWAPRPLRAKSTFQALAQSAVDAYHDAVGCVRKPQRLMLYSGGFRGALDDYDPVCQMHDIAAKGPSDPLAVLQNLDYHMYLPGDINVKVDRASMACSLETREPLMDHPLMEWVAGLPQGMKIHDGETKYLFKKAFEPYLSRDILYRPKMGFSVPLSDWFRGRLNDHLRERATSAHGFAHDLLESNEVVRMLDDHAQGRRNWATPLWTVLMYDAFATQLDSARRFEGPVDRVASDSSESV